MTLRIRTLEETTRPKLVTALETKVEEKGYAVINEGRINSRDGDKVPDIILARRDCITRLDDEVIVEKRGIKAVVETKKQKTDVMEGFLQAVDYATFQLGCKLGFTTNFREIVAFELGDEPKVGPKVSFGDIATRTTINAVADYIVGVLEQKIPLVPTVRSDKENIDILQGAVSEILGYLDEIEPLKLENPLGLLTQAMDLTAKSAKEKAVIRGVVRRAAAYLVVNQILFYSTLAQHHPILPKLKRVQTTEELQEYFDKVLGPPISDYGPVFKPRLAPLLPDHATEAINRVITGITELKLDEVRHDILGKVFHELIPYEVRHRLGAYYTKNGPARLLAHLAVKNARPTVLDQSCGSGTLLVAAYHRKKDFALEGRQTFRPANLHKKLLSEIYGIDVTYFAAHLAVLNLSLQEVVAETDKVQVTCEDTFNVKPNESIEFLSGTIIQTRMTARGLEKESFVIPKVNLVIQNPPFTRSKRLETDYRSMINQRMKHWNTLIQKRLPLYCYFLLHAHDFLDPRGRLAAVLPGALFQSNYSRDLLKFYLKDYVIEYFVTSEQDVHFSEGCDFKEVLFVARKRTSGDPSDWTAKFAVLKGDLTLENADRIADAIETHNEPYEDSRVSLLPVKKTELEREWNWMTFTRPRGLSQSVEVIARSRSVRNGNEVFSPARGLDLNAPEFFIIPNEVWGLSKEDPSTVFLKNVRTSKTLVLSKQYLRKSLRRPELHLRISPEGQYYLLLIPPQESISGDLKAYVEWGNYEKVSKIPYLASESRKRGVPWFSFAYDDFMHRKSHGNVILIDKFRLKNRPCVAYYSDQEVTGSNNFYFGTLGDPEKDKVLTGWFNSTPFLALFLYYKREISGDWSRMKITDLDRYPCLDPSKISPVIRKEIAGIVDDIRFSDLPKIPDQIGTEPRRKLDLAVLRALETPDPVVVLDNLYLAIQKEFAK